MKTMVGHFLGRFAAPVVMALAAGLLRAEPQDAVRFPYTIPVELGAVEFALGDDITLTSLRGDRPHLEVGGSYLLEGTYTLASAPNGKIGVSITTREPIETPVGPNDNVAITKGSGSFRLEKAFTHEGWLHVSFNVDRHRHGGMYFGEDGVDRTILKTKSWSDFDRGVVGSGTSNSGAGDHVAANAAIMRYLGDPVPPPADLKPQYDVRGLESAFNQLAKSARFTLKSLSVDTSEFPYLVYGVIAGRHTFAEIRDALGRMPEYKYGGSVVGNTPDGATYFSVNLTPNGEYSNYDYARRRLMIRLEILAAKVRMEGAP